ncbi:hypothetical protein [Streptomyces sp. NPDC057854]|uniref:hypothetical protein n=1 Tax=unclassified Streptomyces TaxID=2593676 RepID=UPI0036C4C408
MTTPEASARPRSPSGPRHPGAPRPARTARPLVAVAGAFVLAQLALAVPGTGLGWDEAVYVSQVGGNAPPAYFSAPRARGVSYLVAPVAAFTASTGVLRVYLAVLSGAALLGALCVWRPVLPVRVLAVGGGLFAGLWVTLFYGPRVMPNLWCAFGALAAAGFLLRAVAPSGRGRRDRWAVPGLGAAVAAVTLLRPADGLWLALPLAAAALVVPGWRRRRAVPAVVAAGLGLGAVPWLVEAYTSYGGLAARLHRAGEIQGSLGWYFSVDDHVRALAGRTLCRPCDVPWEHPWTALWWLVLPVLVAGGVAAAVRAGRGAAAVLAAVTAASLAFPYLFTVGYAAPRFLLPAYALLALPAAEGVLALVGAVRPGRRRVVAGLLAVALAGHLAVQYAVLHRTVGYSRSVRAQFTGIAAALHGLGVRPPCTVTGREYVPIGYYTGCASRQPRGHDGSITEAGLAELARRGPLAVVVHAGKAPPGYAAGWRVTRLPSAPGWRAFDAYVSPSAR